MITLIIGENAYERDQAIEKIVTGFDGEPERYDGSEMSRLDISQLTQGVSLFAQTRLVVVRGMSDNKEVWDELASQIGRVSDDVHIVLADPKPDKRTKSYKTIQKAAEVVECRPFGEQEVGKATVWLKQYAQERDIQLAPAAATELVERIGTDQYALSNELERLRVMDEITLDVVENYTEPASHDNAFALLELALKGDNSALQRKIRNLSTSDDAYRTLGLLTSQVYALAGLVLIDDDRVDVAKTLGVHPFVLRNLRSVARQLSRHQLSKVINRLAALDMQLKSTASDPWLALEVTLSDIAEITVIKSSA